MRGNVVRMCVLDRGPHLRATGGARCGSTMFSNAHTGLWSDCITSMHALYVFASTVTSEADPSAPAG